VSIFLLDSIVNAQGDAFGQEIISPFSDRNDIIDSGIATFLIFRLCCFYLRAVRQNILGTKAYAAIQGTYYRIQSRPAVLDARKRMSMEQNVLAQSRYV
jgi:hypothetical protein